MKKEIRNKRRHEVISLMLTGGNDVKALFKKDSNKNFQKADANWRKLQAGELANKKTQCELRAGTESKGGRYTACLSLDGQGSGRHVLARI
jgi:hypothetical protein